MQRTAADATCVAAFKPSFSRGLYTTQVNVTGKHLSGLLLIKTMPDSSTRIVFFSEAGFTFFDFEWNKSAFKVHSIYSQMNRKPVIKTLRKDFELILMQHIKAAGAYTMKDSNAYYRVFPNGGDFYYYITDSSCTQLMRMERGSRRKKIMEAVMIGGEDRMPDSIGIRHYNFNFDIGLKRLYDSKR